MAHVLDASSEARKNVNPRSRVGRAVAAVVGKREQVLATLRLGKICRPSGSNATPRRGVGGPSFVRRSTLVRSGPTRDELTSHSLEQERRGARSIRRILIFDEATRSLDAPTAEHFAETVNQLKDKVTMLFIAHALPKNLQMDGGVRIGTGTLSAVGGVADEARPHDNDEKISGSKGAP
jgi:hypothetical protein